MLGSEVPEDKNERPHDTDPVNALPALQHAARDQRTERDWPGHHRPSQKWLVQVLDFSPPGTRTLTGDGVSPTTRPSSTIRVGREDTLMSSAVATPSPFSAAHSFRTASFGSATFALKTGDAETRGLAHGGVAYGFSR